LTVKTSLIVSSTNYTELEGAPLLPPALWSPEIRILVTGNTDLNSTDVEVVFSRPPSEYKFERYEIALASKTDVNVINIASTKEFFYTFYNVYSGDYKIMVNKPQDNKPLINNYVSYC